MPASQTQTSTTLAPGWHKLPGITGNPYENLSTEELDGTPERVQDAYINEAGHTEKRPGLALFKDTGSGNSIDGLYWWDAKGILIVVTNGKVYKITDNAGTMTDLTGTGTPKIGTRCTFATDGSRVFIANGGRILFTDGTTTTIYIIDGNAPTAVTHVVFMDGYILANNVGSTQINWSNPGDYSTWNSLNFANKSGAPDFVTSLVATFGELLIQGIISTERWVDDGVTPFVRLQGGLLPSGISAPYSLAKVGQTWIWLDDKRRLVQLDKNSAVPVSNPFEKTIQDLSLASDAIADTMEIRGYPLYILTFPLADFTLCYNYRLQSWSRWGQWDTNSASYKRYLGNCYAYSKTWNLHFVGHKNNGKVYTASRSTFQDDGGVIRTFRRTGYNTHQHETIKLSHELRMRLQRGKGVSGATTTAPLMSVRWRNDGQAWGTEHQISLGAVGDTYLYGRLLRLGKYKARQWEFIHSDNSDFILIDGSENLTPTSR